jgi:hypothetical protein
VKSGVVAALAPIILLWSSVRYPPQTLHEIFGKVLNGQAVPGAGAADAHARALTRDARAP